MTDQVNFEAQIVHVAIAAGCVIKQDGKYLLVQEKQPKVYGKWNIPAGYVDEGETIEAAAVREVREESGYEVELLCKLGIYHEDALRPVKHFFAAKIVGGTLCIQPEEILDARWFTYSEIKVLHAQGDIRAACVFEAITARENGHQER